MQIIIEYEASWRNSFLEGENDSPLPKKGRKFIGSITKLKREGNFKQREVTLNTVMGLLNRLIGDQRKLYQAREKHFAREYYFEDMEKKIRFEDRPNFSHEIIYLRNMNGSYDQNSFSGILKTTDPIFCSDYSQELWGVMELNLKELCLFITGDNVSLIGSDLNPRHICELFEKRGKEKPVQKEEIIHTVIELERKFPTESYMNSKGLIIPSMMYCSALYIQLERLEKKYDMSSIKTKSGGIAGISKRNFTEKDFMKRFTTGNGKRIWGNPYLKKEKIKGEGEVSSMLAKANGQLEIIIDVNKEKGHEIAQLIENAAISSFYLGKKGLAYVSKIRL